VAIDHPWVKEHPDFFVTSEAKRSGTIQPQRSATRWFAHGDCGHGNPWVDTLQLDYRNPALRAAMMRELQSVMARCDGVRCDMAMLELNDVFACTWRDFPSSHAMPETEFWSEAIEACRRMRPDCMFMAEVYWDLEERLHELGFNFTYDKRLYDRIVARSGIDVARYLRSCTPAFLNHGVHFIENHDEPRIASLLSFEEQRSAALLILGLPGMRFLHEGQMAGTRAHANVHFARRRTEPGDDAVAGFYERLLSALKQTTIGKGKATLLETRRASEESSTFEQIVVVHWSVEATTFDLVVVNCGADRAQCFVSIPGESLGTSNWRLTDLLGDEVHERSGSELARQGLYFELRPHAAQLFHAVEIP
jgi:hypothetical protein